MNPLANDILNILGKQTEPMSVHDVIVTFPKHDVYNIKKELWDLSANGLIKFDWNWKITRSHDAPATF